MKLYDTFSDTVIFAVLMCSSLPVEVAVSSAAETSS